MSETLKMQFNLWMMTNCSYLVILFFIQVMMSADHCFYLLKEKFWEFTD